MLDGDYAGALAEVRNLRDGGVEREQIVTRGVEEAMAQLDAKCAVEQFNLLEIMLTGRAAMGVIKELYPPTDPPSRMKATVVVGTLEGDVHDIGKNVLKSVLAASGYRVIDCGKDCPVMKMIEHPERFASLLDFTTEVAIRFAGAQIEAGVHLPIVFDPSASPAVIPPQFFREFELLCLQKLFTAHKKAGVAANWLHIAGPAGPILPLYPQCGADIANFDYCISASEAQQAVPHTCLDGNIKPFFFVEAKPENVAAMVLAGRER
jgi:uncharacterized membrane protein